MSDSPEDFALKLANHAYQMHSMLLVLLAIESPERAARLLKTLDYLLGEEQQNLTPGLLDAAADLYTQLSRLLKRPPPPAGAAGTARTRPAWLKGVVDGGLSE